MTAPLFPGAKTVSEGEFAGWSYWDSDPFENRAGPFYMNRDAGGETVCAFRAEPRHMNTGGFTHGGCLMSFADFALFSVAQDAMDGDHGVTLNMGSDFLAPSKVGQLIEARGRVVRAGGKTIFVEGLVTADGEPVLRFNGIIRKIRSN
ncbi:MAG: PaaI family thioesterase [Parerythrobacter sp.]